MAFGDNQERNFVAVGTVDHKSARLWFRAERPGRYNVEVLGPKGILHGRATVDVLPGKPTDNTATLTYPAAATPPLSPLHR